MENSEKKQPQEFTDAISFLESEHEIIYDRLRELEKISRDIDKNGIDALKRTRIRKIVGSIHDDLIKFFGLEEELLFRELETVLPAQSSTSVMRKEHQLILQMCGSTVEKTGNPEEPDGLREELQSAIANLVDLLQRHFHKKNSILYFEARTMLSKEVLDKIYSEMCKKIKRNGV